MKSVTDLRRFAAVMLSCAIMVSLVVPVFGEVPIEKYTVNMSFDHDGLTNVEILYDSGLSGSGASWVAVPKDFTETTVTVLRGAISSMVRTAYQTSVEGAVHPFYDNLTFSYSSGNEPFYMRLSFNMTNGAMIVEPNGFFFSPQIGVPSSARVQANLIFPDGVRTLGEVQPAPTRVDSSGPKMRLSFNPSSQSRIAATFRVSWTPQTIQIRDERVQADVPTRYLNLGIEIVELYKRAIPLMNDLFNTTVDKISMRFFTPPTLPELSIGGYIPIDPSNFQVGTIHLNLFYFRALDGLIEAIAMHELTHQYEANAGISPKLLWVQEGLANYAAVQMGKLMNYDITSTDADLEATARGLDGNYGMIQYWQPETTTVSLYEYYAGSYDIFKSIGDKYGDLTLYSTFFAQLDKLANGLTSTNVAVYELSRAAKTDLSRQFTQWGFEINNLYEINDRIVKLHSKAELLGPLLPFREEAQRQLDQAESSVYSSPETSAEHITIASFYIETVPITLAGLLLVLILVVVAAIVVGRKRRQEIECEAHVGRCVTLSHNVAE
jgi:hypothetical protein